MTPKLGSRCIPIQAAPTLIPLRIAACVPLHPNSRFSNTHKIASRPLPPPHSTTDARPTDTPPQPPRSHQVSTRKTKIDYEVPKRVTEGTSLTRFETWGCKNLKFGCERTSCNPGHQCHALCNQHRRRDNQYCQQFQARFFQRIPLQTRNAASPNIAV